MITGAGSGLGAAFAKALSSSGYRVYGTSRRPAECAGNPGVHWLALDASHPQALADFIREQAPLLRDLDLLINNAGASWFGDIVDQPHGEIGALLHLLLQAPIALSQAVLPGMRQRGSGTIVNVSSLAALFPLPYMAVYTAAKAGLSAFTQDLALTEGSGGVRWIDFQAGDFRTAFNRNLAHGKLNARQQQALIGLERAMAAAPAAEQAAFDLVRALRRQRSGTIRSGGWFQSRLAPLGWRLLPARCLHQLIRHYYGIQRPTP